MFLLYCPTAAAYKDPWQQIRNLSRPSQTQVDKEPLFRLTDHYAAGCTCTRSLNGATGAKLIANYCIRCRWQVMGRAGSRECCQGCTWDTHTIHIFTSHVHLHTFKAVWNLNWDTAVISKVFRLRPVTFCREGRCFILEYPDLKKQTCIPVNLVTACILLF